MVPAELREPLHSLVGRDAENEIGAELQQHLSAAKRAHCGVR